MDHEERSGPFRTGPAGLILASASPRRRMLLAGLGLQFEVVVSGAQELGASAGLAPEALAVENSRLKASEVAESRPESFVLGADTIVVLDGRILGKPRDMDHAKAMLSDLSGRWHKVVTGCTLMLAGEGIVRSFFVESRVFLAEVAEELIEAYCASGEPLDKAGGYAVQGAGAFMVRSIEGSWTNVVGLPLHETVMALLEAKAIEAIVPGRG